MFAFYLKSLVLKTKCRSFALPLGSPRSRQADPLAPTFHLRNYTLDLLARILNRY